MGFSLVPAYGRDYKSKKAVTADFEADKDFINQSFGQDEGVINKADIAKLGGGSVGLRYARLTKQVYVHVEPA